jgi:CheY-like chemotaxis protein
VYFPVSTKAPARPDPYQRDEVPGGSETILVVEDESSLRELVQEILIKKGYRVYDAPNGVAALDIWKEHGHEIDLLLTDMMMPEGVSGKELADRALQDKKGLKVLYTSGYSLEVVDPGFTDDAGCRFLQKPYHPETLAQAVRDCLSDSEA